MGKKYIVEIGRLERLYKAFISAHGKPEIAWLSPEVDLTPYTEPDLEQIRKEAYKEGREVGIKDGMCEVWDAARKIENLPEAEKFEIFGEYDMFHIMRRYTAVEAIEKIRQYEQSQKEKPIRAEDVMRQYLDEFCKRRWCCAECVLRTDDFTCGRGYSFTGITPVSDEEVRRAYAEVMKK